MHVGDKHLRDAIDSDASRVVERLGRELADSALCAINHYAKKAM